MFQSLGPLACPDSELTSETVNLSDVSIRILRGGTARRKASSYTGQQDTKNAEGIRNHDSRFRAVQDQTRLKQSGH